MNQVPRTLCINETSSRVKERERNEREEERRDGEKGEGIAVAEDRIAPAEDAPLQ